MDDKALGRPDGLQILAVWFIAMPMGFGSYGVYIMFPPVGALMLGAILAMVVFGTVLFWQNKSADGLREQFVRVEKYLRPFWWISVLICLGTLVLWMRVPLVWDFVAGMLIMAGWFAIKIHERIQLVEQT